MPEITKVENEKMENKEKETRKRRITDRKIWTKEAIKKLARYVYRKISIINILRSILGDPVKTFKSGSEELYYCVFHHDTKPSMYVNKLRNVFHCFGCGASGTLIDFLYQVYGDAIDKEKDTITGISEVLYEKFFPEENKEVIMNTIEAVLTNQQIYEEHIKKFTENIKKYSHILHFLEKRYGIDTNKLIAENLIGIMNSDEHYYLNEIANNVYDISKERIGIVITHLHSLKPYHILIPLRDYWKFYYGFIQRNIIDTQNENMPKYVFSKILAIFQNKNGVSEYITNKLFGLDRGIEVKKDDIWMKVFLTIKEPLYITEGILDALYLISNNVNNVISINGKPKFNKLLKNVIKKTKRLIILYDNDEAGVKIRNEIMKKRPKKKLTCEMIVGNIQGTKIYMHVRGV